MFLEQKNRDWKPTTTIENLKSRAKLLSDIRVFFDKRDVLEVETPLMCSSAALDLHLKPIPVFYQEQFYLQTSPEFAMKRLLSAGSGPIYQICKAFRGDEIGRLHNPEFTMLEWYRPGFDHHALMDEMDELLHTILKAPKAERLTYAALFNQKLTINPQEASLEQLEHCAVVHGIHLSEHAKDDLTTDDWLDLLMTHCIEPQLGFERPVMIYDYPASKAALAKVSAHDPRVAERFEVYIQGMELANGYHELTDAEVQLARFKQDCELREKQGYPMIPVDYYLIEALKAGLPPSAGVALGVDRLLMIKLGSHHLQEVVAFTTDRV